MTWRERFRPLIAAILAATEGKPEKEIRAALAATVGGWPYKVWRDEIARQRRRAKGRIKYRRKTKQRRGRVENPQQVPLPLPPL